MQRVCGTRGWWQQYGGAAETSGAHRFSYNIDETSFANDDGFISRSSRSLYMAILNLISSQNVVTSVARPHRPMNSWSCTLNT